MKSKSSHAGIACSILAFTVCFALPGLFTGCASTSQGRTADMSGFLGDYSVLTEGAEGQAQLVYVNPTAKFADYTEILMDPIVVCAASDNSPLSKVPEDEMKTLLDYLDATVRGQLQEDYAFVPVAGPRTMRLRIALTEAKGANVVLSAASSVTPVGLAVNGLKKAVTGASTGVGATSAEMELVDAQTGERLAAAVDERIGSKVNSFSEWQAAKDAFDYWAGRLKVRLAELRAN
jgi:hypothetical protein